MTSKIYGDNDESCFNKISLNEKNNKGIGNTPMIKINYRYNIKVKELLARLMDGTITKKNQCLLSLNITI